MKHLVVIQADGSKNYEAFDPERHDFRWSADYQVFKPVPLRWHSDASYAAYQAEDDGAVGWSSDMYVPNA